MIKKTLLGVTFLFFLTSCTDKKRPFFDCQSITSAWSDSINLSKDEIALKIKECAWVERELLPGEIGVRILDCARISLSLSDSTQELEPEIIPNQNSEIDNEEIEQQVEALDPSEVLCDYCQQKVLRESTINEGMIGSSFIQIVMGHNCSMDCLEKGVRQKG